MIIWPKVRQFPKAYLCNVSSGENYEEKPSFKDGLLHLRRMTLHFPLCGIPSWVTGVRRDHPTDTARALATSWPFDSGRKEVGLFLSLSPSSLFLPSPSLGILEMSLVGNTATNPNSLIFELTGCWARMIKYGNRYACNTITNYSLKYLVSPLIDGGYG